VGNEGRKIVFTTNLPNVRDLDEALVRPGRCFARLRTRGLRPAEADRLVRRLGQLHGEPAELGLALFERRARATYSVAELYGLMRDRDRLAELERGLPLSLVHGT